MKDCKKPKVENAFANVYISLIVKVGKNGVADL